MKLPELRIREFRTLIRDFYRRHKRKMPWRNTRDPYRIVVSEIMLQQTQVSRVMEKYPAFIAAFPDFRTLARAPLRSVLRAWQGLGYNRRAVALHALAGIVMKQSDGRLPHDPAVLEELPGIGKATAGSIAAFAFNQPAVFIETNIRRVFLHHFFRGRRGVDDEAIRPLIAATLDGRNPREWYYALFDYGSWLAKEIENPNRRHLRYRKQPKFEGSPRQLRGQIVKLLSENPILANNAIAAKLSKPVSKVAAARSALEKEGFRF